MFLLPNIYHGSNITISLSGGLASDTQWRFHTSMLPIVIPVLLTLVYEYDIYLPVLIGQVSTATRYTLLDVLYR